MHLRYFSLRITIAICVLLLLLVPWGVAKLGN